MINVFHDYISELADVIGTRATAACSFSSMRRIEKEGDLVIPAQMCTPQAINFMAKYGRGHVSP